MRCPIFPIYLHVIESIHDRMIPSVNRQLKKSWHKALLAKNSLNKGLGSDSQIPSKFLTINGKLMQGKIVIKNHSFSIHKRPRTKGKRESIVISQRAQ